LVALESSYNELTVLAAKERTDELSFLAAGRVSERSGSLPETRVRGLPAGNHAGVGGCWPVTSTLVWGCGYSCDGTASGSLDQRFYASTYGNFTSPDPSMNNVDYTNPASWNAYAYTMGDPINGNDPSGLQTCGQTPIVGGAFNGQTVSQVFTGTSGNDLLAQEIWHEGGTIYSSDLTSQASAAAYEQDLAAIGTAILNQWDVDDGRLKVYQNGRAVCPLGQCLDRSLAQIIETIATYSSGGQMVSVFNSSGQMQGPAAATLSGILGTNIDSGPLVLDSSGQYVNQGCEGVLASLVTGSGLLGGTTPRVSPNGLTLLFWNQASATSTTTFPGNVGYTGWRDARTRGETFWGLSSTAPPPIRRPPPRRPR
jgi:RHS repeat-associated protein